MKVLIANLDTPNYIKAMSHFGAECVNTREIPESIEEYDALILPGGDDIDPVFFHQEMNGSRDNVCFGGDIIQDLPDGKREHHSYHQGLGTGEYHETDIAPGSFLAKLYGEHVVTNSYHHQAIGKVGEGLEVLQKSDDGVIEFMAHRSLPIYAVQWHPEKNCWDTAKEGVADGEPLFTYFAEKIRKGK